LNFQVSEAIPNPIEPIYRAEELFKVVDRNEERVEEKAEMSWISDEVAETEQKIS